MATVWLFRISSGRLFHASRPERAKARSPKVLKLVLEIVRRLLSQERRWWSKSECGCRYSFMYCGPWLLRDLWTKTTGMAKWWERSPPTNMSRVRFPDPASYNDVGWVCCWFSTLLREVFLRVLRFSPLLKNQVSRKFQFDPGVHGHFILWTPGALWVKKIHFLHFTFDKSQEVSEDEIRRTKCDQTLES